jgi:hypothetical protein
MFPITAKALSLTIFRMFEDCLTDKFFSPQIQKIFLHMLNIGQTMEVVSEPFVVCFR